MNISGAVNRTIDNIPPGKLFGYEVFAEYLNSPNAVIRAVGRRVEKGRLIRVEKGIFYTPKQGILGEVPVSDEERLRNLLFKNGRRVGYITGAALYNRLGLSTQIPRSFTIASERAPQTKDFGTLQVKLIRARAPITEATVPLLEILDVLRSPKQVQGTDVGEVLRILARYLDELAPVQTKKLQRLALAYYNAGTRALLAMLLTRNGVEVQQFVRGSFNPTTRFEVGLDPAEWPEARAWGIR